MLCDHFTLNWDVKVNPPYKVQYCFLFYLFIFCSFEKLERSRWVWLWKTKKKKRKKSREKIFPVNLDMYQFFFYNLYTYIFTKYQELVKPCRSEVWRVLWEPVEVWCQGFVECSLCSALTRFGIKGLLVGSVLWHINFCRLFNAKSIFMQIISYISNNSVSYEYTV